MHTLSSSSVFELVEPVAQLVGVLYPNGYLPMHLMYNCYWTNLTSCSICKGFFEGFEDVELKIYKSKSLRAFMYMRLATFKLWSQLFLSFKYLMSAFILKLVFISSVSSGLHNFHCIMSFGCYTMIEEFILFFICLVRSGFQVR